LCGSLLNSAALLICFAQIIYHPALRTETNGTFDPKAARVEARNGAVNT
jgi:hypothetical protein